MLKAIMSILGIKTQTRIAKVSSHSNGASLIVQTTLGREVIKGVTDIVELGDFVVFVSNGYPGGGGVVAKDTLVSAIPE